MNVLDILITGNYNTIIKAITAAGIEEVGYSSKDANYQEMMAINTAFTMISNFDKRKDCKDEKRNAKLDAKIENKKTSLEKILAEIENMRKLQNRTLHTFDTLKELNDFTKNRECGKAWNAGKTWNVYCYSIIVNDEILAKIEKNEDVLESFLDLEIKSLTLNKENMLRAIDDLRCEIRNITNNDKDVMLNFEMRFKKYI